MDIHQIQNIILQTTYTKSDYLRRVSLLRGYLEQKYFKSSQKTFAEYLIAEKSTEHDRAATSLWDDNFFNFFNQDNLYLYINGLIKSLNSLPVLTLYVPIVLEDFQIDELSKWFRSNLHPEVIIDIRLNPSLVTGCAYVWRNNYKDLSLHYFFSKKQEIISKIIETYAKEHLATVN